MSSHGEAAPILELRGVVKDFPGVRALKGVDFRVGPGEIVGLVGENGAGKSTLMKVLIGLHRMDAGSMTVRGVSFTRAISRTPSATAWAWSSRSRAFCPISPWPKTSCSATRGSSPAGRFSA